MCKILDALHEYVPSVTEKTELISDDGETISHLDYYLIRQLLGGDYLTVARANGAIGIRSNHEDAIGAVGHHISDHGTINSTAILFFYHIRK